MTNPFSKDWKPSPESAKRLAADRKNTALSLRNSATRARKLESDDPAEVNQAMGTVPGMGRDFAPKRAGKGGA
jgi:hypothetical protein